MKKAAIPAPRASRLPTFVVWTLAALNLLAGGVIAGGLVLIPTSFDPVETISAGISPWADAAYAVIAWLGLIACTAFALRVWHSRRYRAVGASLTALLTLGVAWACAAFCAEYF